MIISINKYSLSKRKYNSSLNEDMFINHNEKYDYIDIYFFLRKVNYISIILIKK